MFKETSMCQYTWLSTSVQRLFKLYENTLWWNMYCPLTHFLLKGFAILLKSCWILLFTSSVWAINRYIFIRQQYSQAWLVVQYASSSVCSLPCLWQHWVFLTSNVQHISYDDQNIKLQTLMERISTKTMSRSNPDRNQGSKIGHTFSPLSIPGTLANSGSLCAHVCWRGQTALSMECVMLTCDYTRARVLKKKWLSGFTCLRGSIY